ncbi:MAG: heavy metal translocating P-type ATPase, partial [Myxococcota bacterium]
MTDHNHEDEHHDHDHDHGRSHNHSHDHGGSRAELGFAIAAGVCVAIGWLLPEFVPSLGEDVWGLVPFWLAYFFGGFFTLKEVIEHVREGSFEIDFLMVVAALGAALLGEWLEGALLLFLFSLGHGLEHYAMSRARGAIESLADLAPEDAIV